MEGSIVRSVRELGVLESYRLHREQQVDIKDGWKLEVFQDDLFPMKLMPDCSPRQAACHHGS